MSNPLQEHLEVSKAKRLAGVVPNFDCEHDCPKCGRSYLCPDRYEYEFCAPSKGFDRPVRSYTCLPCSVGLDGPMLDAWYEAHGIRESIAA